MVLSRLFKKKRPADKPSGNVQAAAAAPPAAFDEHVRQPEPEAYDRVEPARLGPSAPQQSLAQQAAEQARSLADLTTKKIDQIESEMSQEILLQQPRDPVPAPPAEKKTATHAATRQPAKAADSSMSSMNRTATGGASGSPPTTTMDLISTIGFSTDILLGDSILSNAVDLSDAISNPAMEETAILFADGEWAAAVDVLKESIDGRAANSGNIHAWLMLLELYRATGDKARFMNLSIDYTLRFESPAPPWSDPGASRTAGSTKPEQPDRERPSVEFMGALSTAITPELDRLKRLTPSHHTLYVDFSKVSSVEASGARLILRMLTAFSKSNHVLVVAGAERLAEKSYAAIEREPDQTSGAVWKLFLEMCRLLGRRSEFEEKGAVYAALFKVPVAPWEPYPAAVQTGFETIVDPGDPVDNQDQPRDTIALSGQLLGAAKEELARLSSFATTVDRVCIDCSELSRIDFAAAGALLNWSVSLQKHHKSIEFRRVSHLVGTLLVVMGIHEVAQIERR